jgi:transcriptional regulator GlxA family with amidase domain
VNAIASKVGFGTATNLRTHFAGAFGVTPGAYRRTFTTHTADESN